MVAEWFKSSTLSQDRKENVPKCSGQEISRDVLGKTRFPGNGIREHRPLVNDVETQMTAEVPGLNPRSGL